MKKCSVCKKNIAMLFASTYENGKPEMKGLCLNCAKKMNIPGIDDLIKQTGMSEEELSAITDQMNDSMSMFDDDSEMDFLSNFKDADKEDEIQIEENEEAEAHQDEVDDKEPSKKKKKKKKYLDTFGTNLTDKASKNQIDKVIGRDKEIQRVIQILNRRAKNNPVLVGEPGVGKTAIAEVSRFLDIPENQVEDKVSLELKVSYPKAETLVEIEQAVEAGTFQVTVYGSVKQSAAAPFGFDKSN